MSPPPTLVTRFRSGTFPLEGKRGRGESFDKREAWSARIGGSKTPTAVQSGPTKGEAESDD